MKKFSILLVDDEAIIRKTLSLDLKDHGYIVKTASNGEEGIKKLEKEKYDLVITDLMMEGIGGIEVLKEAKSKSFEIKVIILTAYGSLTSAIDALRLGASDYVLKPYNKEEILMRVSSCLEKLDLQRKVKLYESLLPMCSICKKIRDDSETEPGEGKWIDADTYLQKMVKINISHGYCNECLDAKKHEIYLQKQKNMQAVKQLAK